MNNIITYQNDNGDIVAYRNPNSNIIVLAMAARSTEVAYQKRLIDDFKVASPQERREQLIKLRKPTNFNY